VEVRFPLEPLFFKRKLLGYEVVMGVIVIIALGFVMGTETQYRRVFNY